MDLDRLETLHGPSLYPDSNKLAKRKFLRHFGKFEHRLDIRWYLGIIINLLGVILDSCFKWESP